MIRTERARHAQGRPKGDHANISVRPHVEGPDAAQLRPGPATSVPRAHDALGCSPCRPLPTWVTG